MKFTRLSWPAARLRHTIRCSIPWAPSRLLLCCGCGPTGVGPRLRRKYQRPTRQLPETSFSRAPLNGKIAQNKKQKPVPIQWNGLLKLRLEGQSALRFGGFFLLGLFFLFLELEFVADKFEDGHLGVVADSIAGVDDASVASGAIREFRGDFAEQFLGDGRKHDVGRRHA